VHGQWVAAIVRVFYYINNSMVLFPFLNQLNVFINGFDRLSKKWEMYEMNKLRVLRITIG
jgi:hypothetical protein